MLRLRSVVLAAALLGVPRALAPRALSSQPSVYSEIAALGPELADFLAELGRAIADAADSLVATPPDVTTVVEVQNVMRSERRSGIRREAVSLEVRSRDFPRHLILDYAPRDRRRAAAHLLAQL